MQLILHKRSAVWGRLALVPLILCFVLCLHAQRDSIAFVNGNWKTDSLDGMVLHQCQFDGKQLFASNQQIFVLEIPDTSHYTLAFAHEPRRTRTSEMALKHAAVAALNGSFFDMEKHFPICYLRIDSVNLGENTPGKDTVNRKYYQYGTLCLGGDSVVILKTDSSRRWEEALSYPNIMTAGPLLIWHDTLQYMRDDRTFVTNRHNRTALGIRPDGTTLLLVADGRFKHNAEGLSLPELERIMLWLGCSDAINIDGGGSSTMYVKGRPDNGVVNYPSDNRRHDHEGQRPVSNAVLVL